MKGLDSMRVPETCLQAFMKQKKERLCALQILIRNQTDNVEFRC